MATNPFLNQSIDSGNGIPMPVLKAGQRLFNGRYELVRQLGAGGMGVVWLARDHTEHAEVALKFLPPMLVLQEAELKRLREEVRAGKELRHPRIVATYGLEVDAESGAAAIVMEYVNGKTLQELLGAQTRGFFEPGEIAAWVADVGGAIEYLHHDVRRIHRDLKPANIIVDKNGRARLMDFGISRRIQESVTRHSKAGDKQSASSNTLAYASPQQLAGDPAAFADDIYSLGAMLYELLTGTPPFFRGDADLVRGQIKHEPVRPLRQRRQELVDEGINTSTGQVVSKAVENIVLRCMSKEREGRPTGASKVVESFDSAAAPQQDTAPRSKAVQKQPHPSMSNKSRVLVISILAAASLGTVILFMEQRSLKHSAASHETFTNSLGMKFVSVAAAEQAPAVRFCVWETRSRDYAAFVKSGFYTTASDNADDWKTFTFQGCPVGRGEGEPAAESNHPVVNVSPEEAAAFCAWLTQKERQAGLISADEEYRLPTLAEWRSAAVVVDAHGNYADENTENRGIRLPGIAKGRHDGFATTAPVGSFPAGINGLFDASGNVWEMTLSADAKTGRPLYIIDGSGWTDAAPDPDRNEGRRLPSRARAYDVGFRCVIAKINNKRL